jgi:hypothetical protein
MGKEIRTIFDEVNELSLAVRSSCWRRYLYARVAALYKRYAYFDACTCLTWCHSTSRLIGLLKVGVPQPWEK